MGRRVSSITTKALGVASTITTKTFANVFVANDGRPDLIVTDLATELYAIYRNEGNGLFRYSTLPTGLNQNPTDSVGRRWASG